MANQTTNMNHESFSSAFFNALVRAITAASGSPWRIAAMPGEEPAADQSEPVRIKLMLDGSLRGGFFLELCRAEAAVLASKLLGHAVDEFGAEQSEALLKIVRTTANEFRSALEAQYGALTINAFAASQLPLGATKFAQAVAMDDQSNHVSIAMYLDAALVTVLSFRSQAGSDAAGTMDAAKAAVRKAIPDASNLNLVMDVELNVTLRFGQRRLTLREVLDLTSGSVVELDRQVDEPVELLLDGVVIAKGEAVVIDGNYGLRVTEVSQAVQAPVFH